MRRALHPWPSRSPEGRTGSMLVFRRPCHLEGLDGGGGRSAEEEAILYDAAGARTAGGWEEMSWKIRT